MHLGVLGKKDLNGTTMSVYIKNVCRKYLYVYLCVYMGVWKCIQQRENKTTIDSGFITTGCGNRFGRGHGGETLWGFTSSHAPWIFNIMS